MLPGERLYDVLHEVGSADAYANLALSQIQRSHEPRCVMPGSVPRW